MKNEQLLELRELLLTAPVPWSTRLVAILASLVLLVSVLWLVRSRKLGEAYTPIWFLAGLVTMTISIWPRPFLPLTRILGAWSHTSIAVFFALLFLLAVCLSYAVRLCSLSLQVKNLSQEITICREFIERQGRRPTGGANSPEGPQSTIRSDEE